MQGTERDQIPAESEPTVAAGSVEGAQAPGAVIEECAREAEALFTSGSHHCAEALLAVIRGHFVPQAPEAMLALATGLGGGLGAGCVCGALAASALAFGMALPEEKQEVVALTCQVHDWFKETYGAACCRALQNSDLPGCRVSPGAVAGKVAELLLAREKGQS